jgi:hypothetical protein
MPDLHSSCQQDFLDGFTPEEHQKRCTCATADEHRATKSWRVSVAQLVREDWPTQKEALDHADRLQTAGHWVTVRYWSGGQWHRYATFGPTESVTGALARTSPDTPGPFRSAPEQLGTEADTDA